MAMCFLANLSISLRAGYEQANRGMVLSHTAGLCLAVLLGVTLSTLETAPNSVHTL